MNFDAAQQQWMGNSMDKSAFLETLSKSLNSNNMGGSCSLNKRGFLEAYYNFNMSRKGAALTADLTTFLADFNCCGLQLNDMHELLLHFEEAHFQDKDEDMMMMEDEDTTEGLQFQFDNNYEEGEGGTFMDLDMNMDDSSSTPTDWFFPNGVPLSAIYTQRTESQISFKSNTSTSYNPDKNDIINNSSSSKPWLQEMSVSPPNFSPGALNRGRQGSSSPARKLTMLESPTTTTPTNMESSFTFTSPTAAVASAPSSVSPASSSSSSSTSRASKASTVVKAIAVVPSSSKGNSPAYKGARNRKTVKALDLGDELEKGVERPYRCKHADCDKSYKNPGGLKYHLHHGHCEDFGDPEMNDLIHKPHICTVDDCLKRYKNLNGLKYHLEHAHLQ